MEQRPLFSIITVTYNAADTVAVTMRSVAEQTCTLYEHLIMDGASRDNTLQSVNELSSARTRVVSKPDHGIYDAMNNGLDCATGDYLIFLNAGDAFHSADTLQQLADVILDNDYPGIVYGQTNLVDADGNYVGPRHLTAPEVLTMDSFKHGMLVCHQAFVALKRLAPRYDLQWRFSADYEWCLRCLKRSRRNVYTGTVLIDYLSEGMTTQNRRKSLIERYRIMCRYYGTLPTLFRHIGFFARDVRRKLFPKRK